MYIGCAQTSRQAESRGAAFGEPPAPRKAPALTADKLKKAVTLNRVYARTIGWKDHTAQIAVKLGIREKHPDVWTFVQAVADWQARNGIPPSGILGGEWHDLLTRNR
jgi:hypothetical protein